MTPFEIIPDAIGPAHVASINDEIHDYLPPFQPGQSGRNLMGYPQLHIYLEPLRQWVSRKLGRGMYLRLDKSSYRFQPPTLARGLGWHQDYFALQELRKKWYRRSTYYHTEPHLEPCCTVWLPLQQIDEHTPTLEVAVDLPDHPLEHKADPVGYSILANEINVGPTETFEHMEVGNAIFLRPLTLHRTHVKPSHFRDRRSLDLRFLPRAQA